MEQISSLMDGELDADQAGRQFTRLKNDPQAQANWEIFHLIGDAMRGDSVVSRSFSERLHARFAEEPTVLAPRRSRVRQAVPYALSAAASLSAVALVGWIAFYSPLSPQPQMALDPSAAPVPTVAVAAPQEQQLPNVPSEGAMNGYIMAHQEFSPSTAIQGVAPYIRTVSAVQPPKEAE